MVTREKYYRVENKELGRVAAHEKEMTQFCLERGFTRTRNADGTLSFHLLLKTQNAMFQPQVETAADKSTPAISKSSPSS